MKHIFILMFSLFAAVHLEAADKPNIVFILTDDQGWADLNTPMDPNVPEGSSKFFSTPAVSRLATEGMRFPNGYASSPICTPTRRSIQFGMTPARQRGTEFVSDFSPKGHLSIAQALKRANPLYCCAHFGKWGETMSGAWKPSGQQDPNMEASPERLGYDESDGLTGNTTGTFYHHVFQPKDAYRNLICEPDADPKRTFSVTQRAVAFMERQARNKNPFYLQVSYYAIHTAFQALPATLARYAGRGEPPRQVGVGVAPMLEDLDTAVGQLLDTLDQLGIRENTFVFLSSDNGGEPHLAPVRAAASPDPSRNHPLRMHKQFLYEGGIRVPFIVRGPGVKAGAVCREPVAQYDLLPTFYDLAGGREPLPADVDGGSLRPLIENSGAVKRPLPALVFHRPRLAPLPHSAIRSRDYKLVITGKGPWQVAKRELFDLTRDIGEKDNLAGKMPEKADELAGILISYLKSVNAETASAPAAPKKKPAPKATP